MAWQTHKPSFRGVPFQVRGAGQDAGRRVALHEYPQRDLPYAEDLGRKKREFTLEAYVVGPTVAAQRDALIAAIEQPGPGALMHPYRGGIQVVVTACRITETTDAGGLATFSIAFAEAGTNAHPATLVDTASRVVDRAAAARAAVSAAFSGAFDVAGQPAFVAAAASGWLDRALADIEGLTRSIGGLDLDLLAEFTLDGQRAASALAGLLGAPGDLASRIQGRIQAVLSLPASPLPASPLAALRGLRRLFHFGQDGMATGYSAPAVATTPARQAQIANEAAMTALMRQTAVATAAEASARCEFASFEDATELRESLAAALETESETADDTVYQALMDLRAAVVADITARGADLARIVIVRQRGTLPVLVVAHRLYGDATRAEEIVARNVICHPGFVPGGRDLRVTVAQASLPASSADWKPALQGKPQ